tara:strand:- start:639 stop:839 length:201 start_codon:yes stop_codon:yes gene_type:complete
MVKSPVKQTLNQEPAASLRSKINASKEALRTVLSDDYQDKAFSLGFVPLKGEILNKARAAVNKIDQ